MPLSLGPATRCGFAREALTLAPGWPSAAAAQVSQLLPLLPGSVINEGLTQQFTETASSTRGWEAGDVVTLAPSVRLEMDLQYQGFEWLFALALGFMARRLSSVSMPSFVSPGVYRHLYEVDASLASAVIWTAQEGYLSGDFDPLTRRIRRGTVAIDRTVAIQELLSGMVDQLFLAANQDKVVCTADVMGYTLGHTSAVNTATSLARATPGGSPNVLFTDLALRLAPYSASVALNSSNDMGVSAWSLTLQNRMALKQGPATGTAPEEYDRDGAPILTGSLNLPRYVSNTLPDAWKAGQLLMASAAFTGPFIPHTSTPYALTFWLPALKLTQAQPTLNMGAASLPLAWYALTPPGTPAGFPVHVYADSPLLVELVTGENAHPLL